jgi:hypothetical protein
MTHQCVAAMAGTVVPITRSEWNEKATPSCRSASERYVGFGLILNAPDVTMLVVGFLASNAVWARNSGSTASTTRATAAAMRTNPMTVAYGNDRSELGASHQKKPRHNGDTEKYRRRGEKTGSVGKVGVAQRYGLKTKRTSPSRIDGIGATGNSFRRDSRSLHTSRSRPPVKNRKRPAMSSSLLGRLIVDLGGLLHRRVPMQPSGFDRCCTSHDQCGAPHRRAKAMSRRCSKKDWPEPSSQC